MRTFLLAALTSAIALAPAARADIAASRADIDLALFDDEDDDLSLDDDEDRGEWLSQRGEGKRGKRGPRGDRGRRGKLSPEERKQLQEEVGRRMDTFVTVELASRLDLTQDKALKLSAVVKAHREKTQAQRETVRAEHKKLKELIESGAKDPALKAQTQKVLAASKAVPDREALLDDTAKFLTVSEQAKLVLAFPKIQRQMKRMVKRARGEMRGERGGRGRDRGLDMDDL